MIILNIYNFIFEVHSNSEEITKRLNLDFDYFISTSNAKPNLTLRIDLTDLIPKNIIPDNLKAIFQRQNSITYEKNQVRYNDYYGKVLTIFDSKINEFIAHGTNLDKLYEVVYLFILSRSGKNLDLEGFHKIHAFSIVKNNIGLICMQSMRGGKSTLFTEIIQKNDCEIISDDSPLLSSRGELLPFPLRLSLERIPTNLNLNESQYFIMNREFFKAKFSICLKAFNRQIASPTSQFVFVEAHRSTYTTPHFVKMNKLKFFSKLFYHMIIGFGLPIIFEYFWETGYKDFFKKTKIFISRFCLGIKLAMTKESYDLYLTNNNEMNARAIVEFLNKDR
jgi:hypothetical protein